MPKKPDRRVLRTCRQLRAALLELVLEKDFDTLTITEIADRADLRRATFYLHYDTKEELLLDALQTTFDALAEQADASQRNHIASKSQPDAYRVTFEHVAQHANLYTALFRSSGGAIVTRHIQQYLAGLVLPDLQAQADNMPMPPAVIANYMAGAELALLTWWLDNDMPHTPVEMAQMTRQLVLNGLTGVVPTAT